MKNIVNMANNYFFKMSFFVKYNNLYFKIYYFVFNIQQKI